MIGIIISNEHISCASWEKENNNIKFSYTDSFALNQRLSDILYLESELNFTLTSILKKINSNVPFNNQKLLIVLSDELVDHSVIENERDLSLEEKYKFIKWVESSKYGEKKHSISTFAQTLLPDEKNFHVISLSKKLIRTIKLTIVELGGKLFWMGPASNLIFYGSQIENRCVIYRNSNKYFFLIIFNSRFDLGEILFTSGLPKINFTTNSNSDKILEILGLSNSDSPRLPVYCFDKLGRNATAAWENAKLINNFYEQNLKLDFIKNLSFADLNTLSLLIDTNEITSSLNLVGDEGIIELSTNNLSKESIIIDHQIKPSNEKKIEEISVSNQEDEKEQQKQHLNQHADDKKSIDNNSSTKGLALSLLLIISLFILVNYVKLKNQLNNITYGLNKGFKIDRVELKDKLKINKIDKDQELLMQSRSISSALLSLLTETELNRFNALTISKSFISLEYLSGTNPNIEDILNISPTSFNVEAVGNDSTIFLWYYSFDLPLLQKEHIEGEISKIQLIEKLHEELSEKPKIKYFEKVYTQYQIYGPMLIWIKNKADILQASSIISNMNDSILLRKFVLFNNANEPSPKAGFYVSILED